MEAEIGAVYQTDGLHAAFDFIEQKILPLFLKRRARNKQPGSYRNKS
jgi:dsRNA-specific ribonuclease